VVVTIGRNHVVKKLLHAVGLQVVALHRESIAGLQLVLGESARERWPEDAQSEGTSDGEEDRAADAAAPASSTIVLEAAGTSCALSATQVDSLWAELGGAGRSGPCTFHAAGMPAPLPTPQLRACWGGRYPFGADVRPIT
jgi:hypothetical protein